MRVERQTTYSIEACMVMSRDVLKATDHARGAGAIRDFAPCELDRDEGAAREPMMKRSVVTIRLLMRALYCGITANNEQMMRSKGHSKDSKGNHQKRALLVHPCLAFETGNGTAVRTVCMPWSWFGPGTDDVHFLTPRYEGEPDQI